MSKNISVSVKRAGVAISGLASVPVRLDNISPVVIAGAGGAIPNYSYELYSLQGTPDVRSGDLLTDTVSGEQYRVSGNVEIFDFDHIECLIVKNVQVTP